MADPKCEGYAFTVDGGQTIQSGESRYPNSMRLNIPRKNALSFALDILRNVEHVIDPKEEPYIQIHLFGDLRRVEEDDL